MHAETRRDKSFSEKAKPQVLHDQSINTSLICSQKQMGSLNQLISKDQNVHCEKALHSTGVKPSHDLGQLNKLKIFSSESSIKSLNTEINGICTVGNCGHQGLPIPSRGEQLWGRCGSQRPRAN
jgi:hypothetical protein